MLPRPLLRRQNRRECCPLTDTSLYQPFGRRDTIDCNCSLRAAHEEAGVHSRSAMLASVGRASAQGRARRVGALLAEPTQANILETALKEKGWVLGQNLQVEYRITGGDTDLSQAYARELLALQPDVLFAVTNTSMAALHAERSNIPTVFAMVSDPVGMHYVESFSRPGGNVTGFTPFEPSLGGKWVSLLKEVAPNVEHIGIVYNPEPGNNSSAFRKSIDEVASKVGIASIETPSGDSSDIDRLIRSLKDKPNSGLIFLPDAITSCPTCSDYCAGCAVQATGDLPASPLLRGRRPHVVRGE